jgi:hypothetical protein
MNIILKLEGDQGAQKLLAGFSDRRLNAAVATGLTRTARELEGDWIGEIASHIDRPTGFTARAVVVKTAKADDLQAQVFIRDQPARAGAPAPVEWLTPQEQGGGRDLKKFERALIAQGSMPSGYKVVPGRYATLDQFGNISRAQINQVISQLGRDFSPGYQRTISKSLDRRLAAAKRHGRDYIAVLVQKGELKPGVYQRDGRGLLPVFLYLRTITYRKRVDFIGVSQRNAGPEIARQVGIALDEHIAKLTSQGLR